MIQLKRTLDRTPLTILWFKDIAFNFASLSGNSRYPNYPLKEYAKTLRVNINQGNWVNATQAIFVEAPLTILDRLVSLVIDIERDIIDVPRHFIFDIMENIGNLAIEIISLPIKAAKNVWHWLSNALFGENNNKNINANNIQSTASPHNSGSCVQETDPTIFNTVPPIQFASNIHKGFPSSNMNSSYIPSSKDNTNVNSGAKPTL